MCRFGLSALAVFVLCLGSAGCGKGEPKSGATEMAVEKEPVPVGKLPGVAKPSRYRLTFTIDPAKDRFWGHTEIDLKLASDRRSLYLHGLNLHVTKAELRTRAGLRIAVAYRQVDRSGVARLVFEHRVPAGQATLFFDYDAPFDTTLAGLYKVVDGGIAYAFTQFEATDARRAFPGFDEPGMKARFDVMVLAPKDDKVIGNTPVASQKPAGRGVVRTVFAATKPLPTYLIALAVGPLDIVDGGDIPPNKHRAHPVHLRGITAKGKGDLIRYQLSLTPKVVEALENYFSIAYPFAKLDIIAVPDFSAGAMENAGAITYRERLMLMKPDAPLDQRRLGLKVQAHETTHQWFGDFVTPRWWDDIWLNESFANWLENKASAAVMPQWDFGREDLEANLSVMALDELPSARQIHNPVRNEDDIGNIFDSITYDKGSAVLSMYESYVGEEGMRRGISAYLNKFALGNASAQDFIGTIAEVTGHPEIVASFNSYIDQPGIPDMRVSLDCAPQSATAQVSQSVYAYIGRKAPERRWQVPMCLRGNGVAKTCDLVKDKAAPVSLGPVCPAVLMPNADGKGYYRFTLEGKDWDALIHSAPTLGPADQLTLVHNVSAALHAGQTDAARLFAAIGFSASTAKFDLIDDSRKILHGLRTTVLTAADMPAYRAFVTRNFGPRMTVIGLAAHPGESPAAEMARGHLAQIMVEEARDPSALSALTQAANAWLASSGKNFGGLSPDLLQEALRAGVIAQGTPFARKLLAAYRTSDSEYVHGAIVYGVSGSDDPAFLKSFDDMMLTPAMRTGDLRYVLSYGAEEPVARDALWSWLKVDFAALTKRVSVYGMGRAPGILNSACTLEAKADLESFFGPKAKDLPGVPRSLALAKERIDACIAFKAAKGAEVAAALKVAK